MISIIHNSNHNMVSCTDTLPSLLMKTSAALPISAEGLSNDTVFAAIKDIYTHFVKKMGFTPEGGIANGNETYKALWTECAAYNRGEKWFKDLCHESATIAEVSCYSN